MAVQIGMHRKTKTRKGHVIKNCACNYNCTHWAVDRDASIFSGSHRCLIDLNIASTLHLHANNIITAKKDAVHNTIGLHLGPSRIPEKWLWRHYCCMYKHADLQVIDSVATTTNDATDKIRWAQDNNFSLSRRLCRSGTILARRSLLILRRLLAQSVRLWGYARSSCCGESHFRHLGLRAQNPHIKARVVAGHVCKCACMYCAGDQHYAIFSLFEIFVILKLCLR